MLRLPSLQAPLCHRPRLFAGPLDPLRPGFRLASHLLEAPDYATGASRAIPRVGLSPTGCVTLQAANFTTKGCLFDFTANLPDARNLALIGDLCPGCKAAVRNKHGQGVLQEFAKLTDRKWLGKVGEPDSVVTILKKAFKFDVYIAKGLTPSLSEKAWSTRTTSGVNQVLVIIGTVIAALLIGWASAKLGFPRK
jgi:hypothetical protein